MNDAPEPLLPARGVDADLLPAAIALRDGEPLPAARWLLYALLALLAAAIAWSVLGQVDVVAVAPGQVIPHGRSHIVQSPDGGEVRTLSVRDGETVAAGQLLLELDPADLLVEQARVGVALMAERGELAAARALVQALAADDGPQRNSTGTTATAGAIGATAATTASALLRAAWRADGAADDTGFAGQAGLLASRVEEHRRSLGALRERQAARAAERRALAGTERHLREELRVRTERAQAARSLYRRGLVAREHWVQLDSERRAMEQESRATGERRQALEREIAAAEAERAAFEAGAQRSALAALNEHLRNTESLAHELRRVTQRVQRLRLHAPLAGAVQQLAVRGPGSVVRAAEPLLVIVPAGAPLEVEAFVRGRDIGFVGEQQTAAVKVDTFDFTRYGTLPARVSSVSAEAVEHPRWGAVYPARVALARDWLLVNGRRAVLVPGMAVQVEIRLGTRRIVDYFLSPLRKVARESIRER